MKISKRIFKPGVTHALMGAILLTGSFWPQSNSAMAANPKSGATAAIIQIVVDFGRRGTCTPQQNQQGITCREGFGICRLKITIGPVATKRSARGELSVTADGKLQLKLLGKVQGEGPTLFVDEDIQLSSDIARKLGLKSATITKGEYQFSASKSLLNARLTK